MRIFRRFLFLFVCLLGAGVVFLATPSFASAQDKQPDTDDDKSGVSPQVISLPSGPGSLDGIGESFEPELSTGTASYPIPLTIPPGVAGFTPQVSVVYNGGYANGPWGLGWKLSVPYIQRQVDEGLPNYVDTEDKYIYSQGEKLVAVDGGDYRFENEGQFYRFRWLTDGGWMMQSPDGVTYYFGETANAQVANAYGIFRWHLERQVDLHGNEIHYTYLQDGGYAYLSEITYNFSSDGRSNQIIFRYESRPDVYIDRTSRAPITLAWRCASIEVWALNRFVRSYQFAYSPPDAYSLLSRLHTLIQIGEDGASELPPWLFTYTAFDPQANTTVSMQNPPPISLSDADADLVDINYDSLPDIVYTPIAGMRFYLNQGEGMWQSAPVYPDLAPPERLSSPSVRMADMDGNQQVDWMVKAGGSGGQFYFYPGQPGQLWEQADRIDYNLSPSFTLDDPNMRMLDANHDKLIDVMITTNSLYYIWLAHPDFTWSATADYVFPSLSVGTPLVFSDPHVKLGDMTGDRLQDMVYIRDGLVVFFPYNGNGDYETNGITMQNPPTGIGDLDELILVGDLNNDGLDDLVLGGNHTVHYWLNLGNGSFAPEVILTGTPFWSQADTALRLADVDGDGASELLFSRYPAPVDEVFQCVDFNDGTQPNLLASFDNGLGRTIQIEYLPSTAFYQLDQQAGHPWETTLPFPVQVVNRVTVVDANSDAEYITDYFYHAGYYDGVEKEFRGFARVETEQYGDASAPTTTTHYVFDTGVIEESRKGLILEKATTSQDGQCTPPLLQCYQVEVNQVTTQVLYTGGADQQVTYSFTSQTDTYLYENQAIPVQLRQIFDRDEFGNLIEEFNYGQICGADLACGTDELLRYTQYAFNLDAWLLNAPSAQQQTDLNGNFVSEIRYFYDGPAYTGLPLGQIEVGNLSRQEENLGPLGENRFIPTKRQAFDSYGNVIGILDANDHLTSITYDPLVHTFPVLEQIHLDDGKFLSMVAAYHYGFGKLTAATDFNGNPSVYAYDPFGRITKIVLSGDSLALPTQQFTYTLGSPYSAITTAQREVSGESEVRLSVMYFDGLGRKLQTRSEAEATAQGLPQFVVEGAMTFNARQGEYEQFFPYFSTTLAYQAPAPDQTHTTKLYDPLNRIIQTINPDNSSTSVTYIPLGQVQYDEEDNDPASVHFDTPKTLKNDGLERLVGVIERNWVDGQVEMYETSYAYDLLGNLTQIVDAQGNVKTMQYDGLSRKLYMDDSDRGEMIYAWDDVGNLRQTTDAKGQTVQYFYDPANRPTQEQWLLPDSTTVLAAIYHYDADLSPLHFDAQNTLGYLTYIEDQVGNVYFSYDARGNVAGQIRGFDAEGLEFVTRMKFDAMDRLTELTYPDGMTILQDFNAQGLLENIPGYITDIDYSPSGQRDSIAYANGVSTLSTYDERLRLHQLRTLHAQTILQDLTYSFDATNNIIGLTDARPGITAENDQTQTYTYDSLYRLTQAAGTYGQINYGYNSIGNMLSMTSTVADPRLNLGEMHYGENGAGPHAVTYAGGKSYDYDLNGNRNAWNDTTYTWDARDRLLSVADSDLFSTYAYDANGQRLRQTVNDGTTITTTLYASQYAEVRGDQLVQYVFDGDQRVAEIATPFNSASLMHGFQEGIAYKPNIGVTPRWYIGDHLGGTQLLVNGSGEIVSEVVYYPYGLMRYELNGSGVSYRFTGKELDSTGLYYYGGRFYDCLTTKFISVDSFYLEAPKDELDNSILLNLYAYGNNNPVRYSDPTGFKSEEGSGLLLEVLEALPSFAEGVLKTGQAMVKETLNNDWMATGTDIKAMKLFEKYGNYAGNTSLVADMITVGHDLGVALIDRDGMEVTRVISGGLFMYGSNKLIIPASTAAGTFFGSPEIGVAVGFTFNMLYSQNLYQFGKQIPDAIVGMSDIPNQLLSAGENWANQVIAENNAINDAFGYP